MQNAIRFYFILVSYIPVRGSEVSVRQEEPCALQDQISLPKAPNVIRNVQRKIFGEIGETNDFLESKIGPIHNETYNPHDGYEAYWLGGDWVFDPIATDDDEVCGTICSPMYKMYGPVCGRTKEYFYKTFSDYCAMKRFDCGKVQGWSIVYRGPCKRGHNTFPTSAWTLRLHASSLLANYSLKYNITTSATIK